MRRLFIILLILISTIIVIAGCRNIQVDAQRQEEWKNSRQVITIVVESGESIDGYWAKYAPEWMGREQYRSEIKELNNMVSAMIYTGQKIQVYVEGGN